MNNERVPAASLICSRTEKNALPKIADDRQVSFKIELCYRRKYVSDTFVGEGPFIKGPHQSIDISPGFNIGHIPYQIYASANSPTGSTCFSPFVSMRLSANHTNAIAPMANTVSPTIRIHLKVCINSVCMNSGLRADQ